MGLTRRPCAMKFVNLMRRCCLWKTSIKVTICNILKRFWCFAYQCQITNSLFETLILGFRGAETWLILASKQCRNEAYRIGITALRSGITGHGIRFRKFKWNQGSDFATFLGSGFKILGQKVRSPTIKYTLLRPWVKHLSLWKVPM